MKFYNTNCTTQLDLLDQMYFEFIVMYDRPPEYVYTDSSVCDEYNFLIKMPLNLFDLDLMVSPEVSENESLFIFSDGFNTLEGKL